MLTDKQVRFLQLAQQFESLKEQYVKLADELELSMKDLGVDSYIQDPVSLTVYKIVKPEGTFCYYKDIAYKRTAKEGERGGTVLSKKEAEEAGFVLKK